MTTDDMVILALAAVAVMMILRSGKTGTATGNTVSGYSSQYGAAGITNAAVEGQPGWGWQYFTDGTVISPGGDYYLNGTKIWSPS